MDVGAHQNAIAMSMVKPLDRSNGLASPFCTKVSGIGCAQIRDVIVDENLRGLDSLNLLSAHSLSSTKRLA